MRKYRYLKPNSILRIAKHQTAAGKEKYSIQKRFLYFFWITAIGKVFTTHAAVYKLLYFDYFYEAKNFLASHNRKAKEYLKNKIKTSEVVYKNDRKSND